MTHDCADDHAAATEILEYARVGEAVQILTLTDEELVALDGVESPQITVFPWLDRQNTDRELLMTVALRSLLARRLIAVTTPDRPADPNDASLVAVNEITGPLVLRRSARRILALHRTTSVDQSWCYVYLHDDKVLEEDVDASGQHAFSVYPLAHLPERLLPFIDPQSAAVSTTLPCRLSRVEATLALGKAPFTESIAVTTLTMLDPGTDMAKVQTLYAYPSGVSLFVGDGGDYFTHSLSPVDLLATIASQFNEPDPVRTV